MTASDRLYALEMRLVCCDAPAAILEAGKLCEFVLHHLLGGDGPTHGLGPLIGAVVARPELRARFREHLGPLDRVRGLRNACAHPGKGAPPTLDAAHECREIAVQLAVSAGLLAQAAVGQVREQVAVAVAGTADEVSDVLNRAQQKSRLGTVAAHPTRVLVVVAHGEQGQGHRDFSRLVTDILTTRRRGTWQTWRIPWPAPSQGLANRLAQLLSRLARKLGLSLDLPDAPPQGPGLEAWRDATAALRRTLVAYPLRIHLQHRIGMLHESDPGLVQLYVELVWRSAPYELLSRALSFEVIFAARSGWPLVSASWRRARHERRLADAIRSAVATRDRAQLIWLPVAELGAVKTSDVEEYLLDKGADQSLAHDDARRIMEATGGHFEAVVERLMALSVGEAP